MIYSQGTQLYLFMKSGDHDGTLRLLDGMLGVGIQPDLVTITTVLPACSHLASIDAW